MNLVYADLRSLCAIGGDVLGPGMRVTAPSVTRGVRVFAV